MKLVIFFMALCVGAHAQTHIQVILVTNRPIARVALLDMEQTQDLSTPYKDTVFFAEGKNVIDAYTLQYQEGERTYSQQLWLQPGNDTVMAHIDGRALVIDTVTGAPIYYVAEGFRKTYGDLLKTADSATINHYLLHAYEENIDNVFSYIVGLNYILRNQNSRAGLLRLKTLVDRQGNSLDWSALHSNVTDGLAAHLGVHHIRVGDFSFLDRQGTAGTLSLTGADTYILDFWFLACPPCLEEQTNIQPLLDKLQANHIRVIGIDVDPRNKFGTWKAYLSENGYAWQNYMEGKGGELSNYLAIKAYPTYVVVDKDGEIKGTYSAFSDVLKGVGLEK